jgi:hypothetical protein
MNVNSGVKNTNEEETMKARINIDTLNKIYSFVRICENLGGDIRLVDGNGYCVSAKSLVGAIATMDWSQVIVESEQDIYCHIKDFVED